MKHLDLPVIYFVIKKYVMLAYKLTPPLAILLQERREGQARVE